MLPIASTLGNSSLSTAGGRRLTLKLPVSLPPIPGLIPRPEKGPYAIIDSEVVDYGHATKPGAGMVPSSACLIREMTFAITTCYSTMPELKSLCFKKEGLCDADVIVVRGENHCGKTTMAPALAITMAEDSREASGRVVPMELAHDPEFVFWEAIFSAKMMIVCTSAVVCYQTQKRYSRRYPSLNFNVYFSTAGVAPERIFDKSNTHGQRRNLNVQWNTPTLYKPVHGIIVDVYTANEILERRGFFGTVVVDNCESYNVLPRLPTLIANALVAMKNKPENDLERRRVGRLVLITSDLAEDVPCKFLADMTATMKANNWNVQEITMEATPNTGKPIMRPYNTRFAMHLAGENAQQILDELGVPARVDNGIMHKARTEVHRANPRIGPGCTDFVAAERIPAPLKDAIENMKSPHPRLDMNKLELEEALRVAMEKTIIDSDVDGEIAKVPGVNLKADKRVKNILVLVPSPEQVSAVGKAASNMDMFHIRSAENRAQGRIAGKSGIKGVDYDEAFSTTKMSFNWKFDRAVALDESTPTISTNVYDGRLKTCHRGRMTITTFDNLPGLRIANVHAVVMACSVVTTGRYKSNGLRGPALHFVDGHTIRQIIGRLAVDSYTNAAAVPVIFYGGSEFQLSLQVPTDNRLATNKAGLRLTELLMEFAHPDSGHIVSRARRANERLREMKLDAIHTGMATVSGQRGVDGIVADVDTHKLLNLFPRLDPRWARVLVSGVMMGIATHVVGLAAHVLNKERLFQQATKIPGRSSTVLGYNKPAVDFFISSMNYHRHSDPNIPNFMCPYESEAIALSDLLSCSYEGTYYTRDAAEFKYQDYTGQRQNELYWRIDKGNFWSANWTLTPGGYILDDAFSSLRASIDDYNKRPTPRELFMFFLKDEGREGWHQETHIIEETLAKAGLLPPGCKSIMDAGANTHRLCHGSSYLSMNGRKLLSGLLAMHFSDVAEFDKELDPCEGRPVLPGAAFPKRYAVYDSDIERPVIVHGFSNKITNNASTPPDFAMYAPSENEILSAREKKVQIPRFHAIVHAVSIGHLAYLANVHAELDTTDSFLNGYDVSQLVLPVTGAPCKGKKLRFDICPDEMFAPDEMETETDAQRFQDRSDNLATGIYKTRRYLRTALNAALSGKDMSAYKELIIDLWEAFRTP